MTRVGDTFCQWLKDNNEDRTKMFSFSEVTEEVTDGVADFGLCVEEPEKFLPEEVGVWCGTLRKVMNDSNWKDGKLLAHVHERWHFAQVTQLECLVNGADGIWAGVCEEGASVGHASSTVTIMNMFRMGNTKVLGKYNCQYMRQAAINVTQITTGKQPHYREPVYGERALDLWLPGQENSVREFDLAKFFGEEAPNRISDVSSFEMIRKGWWTCSATIRNSQMQWLKT